MSYDMDMCTGHRDNTIAPCPLRERCKRYILGKKTVSEVAILYGEHYPI